MSSSQADPPDRSVTRVTQNLTKAVSSKLWPAIKSIAIAVPFIAGGVVSVLELRERLGDAEQPPRSTAAVVEEVQEKEDADPPASDNTTTDCHPAYEPCLPNLPGNALDCSDLSPDQKPVTITVIGIDPYNLDANNDGQACFLDTTEDADPPASDNTTTDCHPANEPCLPNHPGNALDCSDLSPDQKPVTITVIGIDPYNLDANNDGQACFVYPT